MNIHEQASEIVNHEFAKASQTKFFWDRFGNNILDEMYRTAIERDQALTEAERSRHFNPKTRFSLQNALLTAAVGGALATLALGGLNTIANITHSVTGMHKEIAYELNNLYNEYVFRVAGISSVISGVTGGLKRWF